MSYKRKLEKKYSTPFEHGTELFSGKWEGRVLGLLHHEEPLRYHDFKDLLPGITDPVLAKVLKKFIQENIVVRTPYEEIPPRVEYTLTQKGWELVKLCQEICSWCCKYYPREPQNEFAYCKNCQVNPIDRQKVEKD